MAQRVSGYQRKPDEAYPTTGVVEWPVLALLPHLGRIRRAWDPAAPERNHDGLVRTLRAHGVVAVGTSEDFFTIAAPPPDVSHIVCNPPYGPRKRGELAVKFIEHALGLGVPHVAMLLRNDFDSAISRQHLFRDNSLFGFKLVLLNRIKWFEGPSSPSDNHAWFYWSTKHVGTPTVRYATRHEAEKYLADRKVMA
jgi:hypothetical protein